MLPNSSFHSSEVTKNWAKFGNLEIQPIWLNWEISGSIDSKICPIWKTSQLLWMIECSVITEILKVTSMTCWYTISCNFDEHLLNEHETVFAKARSWWLQLCIMSHLKRIGNVDCSLCELSPSNSWIWLSSKNKPISIKCWIEFKPLACILPWLNTISTYQSLNNTSSSIIKTEMAIVTWLP